MLHYYLFGASKYGCAQFKQMFSGLRIPKKGDMRQIRTNSIAVKVASGEQLWLGTMLLLAEPLTLIESSTETVLNNICFGWP